MHSYRRAVVLVLATLPFFVSIGIHGQDLPAVLPQGTAEAKSYGLSGHVVNAVTGKPVSRVLIQISKLGRATLTGEEGDFLFDSVPAGRTEILVSKPGYLHADQPLNPDRFHELNNSPYTMTVRHDRTGLVLRLLPEAVIAGTIRGEDGEPLDRAVGYVEAGDPHTNPRELRTVRPGVGSQNHGSFRLGGLAPRRYYVRVVTPPLPANIDASGNGAFVEKRYPQEVYFPSTDASGAAGIDLAGGQQRKVDFSLVRSATPVPASDDASPEEPETSKLEGGPFQVSGVVVDTVHGQPIRHAYVALSLGTKPGGALETGDDGRFFFSDLPAGKYTLVAEARHYPLKYLNGHGGFYSALAVGPGLNTGSGGGRLSPECSFSC